MFIGFYGPRDEIKKTVAPRRADRDTRVVAVRLARGSLGANGSPADFVFGAQCWARTRPSLLQLGHRHNVGDRQTYGSDNRLIVLE